jgi:nitrate/nitrite transport system ATP-binding protein
VLAGFEATDSGEVRVDDAPVRELRRDAIFIFQQPSLFPWLDLADNVTFGLDGESAEARRQLVAHYIALVGLEGFERAFPRQLSGGMQQRAELARALIVKPAILYLDEPFGALDALTRARLQDQVMEIHARLDNTMIMITHDVDEAVLLSDRIVMMTNGPPATIGEVLTVALPRPRRRLDLVDDHEYNRCRAAVLEFLYARHRFVEAA